MTWTPPYLINYTSDGDTVYEAVVKCDNNIADAYSKLTILDTYRTEDHADISQLELAFDSLDSYVDDIASDVATLQQDLDTLEGAVSTLSGTVGGHTTSIGTLQQDLDTLEGTVGGHTTTIGSHTISIGNLTSGKVDIASANTISANHEFTGNPIFSGKLYFTGSGWNITENDSNHHLEFYYNTSLSHYWDDSDGKYWGTSADFDGTIYADSVDTDNHGAGAVVTRKATIRYSTAGNYCDITANSYGSLTISPAGSVAMYVGPSEVITMNNTFKVYNQQAGGHLYSDYIDYGTASSHTWTVDTSNPVNDRWELLDSLIEAFKYHDATRLHKALQIVSKKTVPKDGRSVESMTEEEKVNPELFETVDAIGRSPDDCVQLAVECIRDLTLEVDEMREQIAELRKQLVLVDPKSEISYS